MKKISVILVNYKNSEDTINCAKSLLKQDYPCISIVIVDNSEDKKYVEEIYHALKQETSKITILSENKSQNFQNMEFQKDIVLIEANENRGFSAGNNIGIRIALNNKADYVWILNNDSEVEKNTIVEMLNSSLQYEFPVVTCKIKNFYDREKIQYDGDKIFYLGVEDYSDIIKIPKILSGANLFIETKVFEKTGLLDEDFFLYFEDNHFQHKLFSNKIKYLYTPFAQIYHKSGSSIGKFYNTPLSAYYASRNSLLIEEKLKNYNYIKKLKEIKLYYRLSINSKKILKAILLGIYDFIKGKTGRQNKLDYFINLKPDRNNIDFGQNLEELYQQNSTNLKLNQLLAEKYKNKPEKRIEYLFMLSLFYPRKEKYYKEFFETVKYLLTNKEEKNNGKQSFSLHNQS